MPRRSGGPQAFGELEEVVRVAGRVLEEPEPVEERPGLRYERPEELQGVADPLGRDPRGVKRAGGRREELAEAREVAGEPFPDAPPKDASGHPARRESPSDGRGEALAPFGDTRPEPRDLRGVDTEGGKVVREDPPKNRLVLDPLLEERASDLLGAEGREAPAKFARRGLQRVAVPRPRKAAKEAGRRLETPQGDPNVVHERRVALPAGALLERAEPLLPGRERILQDREDRGGAGARQGGPPPSS